MYHRTSSRRRAGFTLVEALVVVAILAILFGMTTAAVMRALITAEDARVSIEIKQFEAGLAAAKKHFGVEQLPSAIRLRKNNWYDLTPTGPNYILEKRSKEYLAQMFPRMLFATTNDSVKRVDWNKTGNTNVNQPLDLGPAETLVFFLGGLNGTEGWSPNPLDPVIGAGTRVAPFFEFNSDRMSVGQSGFPVYRDPYNPGRPYLYFTSYRSGNDYSEYDLYKGGGDLVRAFADPSTYNSTTQQFKFINPNSFQIISAGRDGKFGNFTLNPTPPPVQTPTINYFVKWRNGTFSTFPSTNPNVVNDNLANFHQTKLGIPQ